MIKQAKTKQMNREKNIELISIYRKELAGYRLDDQQWVDDTVDCCDDGHLAVVAEAYAVVFDFEDM
jgi:hypothetical protein